MTIIVCVNCGNRNKIRGNMSGRLCKKCGARLDQQNRTAPKKRKKMGLCKIIIFVIALIIVIYLITQAMTFLNIL